MAELHDTTHYLKLAYLVEVSIVFNLAYLELKQKDELKKLTDYLKKLIALVSEEKISCTDTRTCGNKCDKKEDHLSSKFEDNSSKSIVRMSEILSSGEFSDWKSMKRLYKSWCKAESFIWFYYWFFHIMVINETDRLITKAALFLTVSILIFITIVDNNIYSFGEYFASMNHLVVYLFWGLAASLIMPSIFWITWNPFFKKLKCLGTLLAKAYQEINKDEKFVPTS